MRVVIQRVKHASVTIEGTERASIGAGMLVLLGIEDRDSDEDIEWLCGKIVRLRIFNDSEGVMNIPVTDVPDSGILLVSQFTLMASTRKGNRPSYIQASKPAIAVHLYERFIARLQQEFGKKVETGVFGADMQVELLNDGPVTIIIDSKMRL